jgi:hypothetical protein
MRRRDRGGTQEEEEGQRGAGTERRRRDREEKEGQRRDKEEKEGQRRMTTSSQHGCDQQQSQACLLLQPQQRPVPQYAHNVLAAPNCKLNRCACCSKQQA